MILENSKDEATSESLPIDAVFKPMLFSTPMVQALLNGTKTQTRRLVKFPANYFGGEVYSNGRFGLKYESKDDCGSQIFWRLNAPINIGDIIWVRETFNNTEFLNITDPNHKYVYKAYYKPLLESKKCPWKPSLFMPKDACRLWLKVINVRCERLNDISGEDAIQEGIIIDSMWPMAIGDAYRAYKTLWEKINGKGSWDINPWVFVYDFEVTNERPYGLI